ncbi:MAG: hypothetical protein ACRDTG_25530 [Pseudonocardiaceae bacterium]
MDRLLPGQELRVDRELVSDNGWLNLVLQGDGNLVLSRTQVAQPLWASNTSGQPVNRVVMQDDGNLVVYSPQEVPLWATMTNGHPGAWIVLQNDGNLVVYDSADNKLWASDTVQNFNTPTIKVVDADGYSYVETSERWKELCTILPCFLALQWPGYSTTIVEDTIEGQPVVIQLWKGWCQRFLGLQSFPGGLGAEVGVYRRIPGKSRPDSLPFLPSVVESFVLNKLGSLTDDELWWPAPELNARIEFDLINPVNGQKFFSAGPEDSYWLAKWMSERSYIRYWVGQEMNAPILPDGYILEYTINGRSRRWPALQSGSAASGDDMAPGDVLTPNASISSANGRFRLVYQDDTNLVLYRDPDGLALWDTRPRPGGVGVCVMQDDGNLVVYNATANAVWASGTEGNAGSRLVVQDDGNVVIYRPNGTPIWATDTVQP